MSDELKEGVEAYSNRDYDTALKKLRPLAKRGIAEAQHYLGVMYVNGEGVVQNYQIAHVWLNIASANGYALSREAREVAEKCLPPDKVLEIQRTAQRYIDSGYEDCL